MNGDPLASASIGWPASHWRIAAADATHPRVPRRSSAQNRGGDWCLAAQSLRGGPGRSFTLAM